MDRSADAVGSVQQSGGDQKTVGEKALTWDGISFAVMITANQNPIWRWSPMVLLALPTGLSGPAKNHLREAMDKIRLRGRVIMETESLDIDGPEKSRGQLHVGLGRLVDKRKSFEMLASVSAATFIELRVAEMPVPQG